MYKKRKKVKCAYYPKKAKPLTPIAKKKKWIGKPFTIYDNSIVLRAYYFRRALKGKRIVVSKNKRSKFLIPRYKTIYKLNTLKISHDKYFYRKYLNYKGKRRSRIFKSSEKENSLKVKVARRKRKKGVRVMKIKKKTGAEMNLKRNRYRKYKPTYSKIVLKTLYKVDNIKVSVKDDLKEKLSQIKNLYLSRLIRDRGLDFLNSCRIYINHLPIIHTTAAFYPIRILRTPLPQYLHKKKDRTFAILRYTTIYKLHNKKWPIGNFRIAVENGLTKRTIYARTFGCYFQGSRRFLTSYRSAKAVAKFIIILGSFCFAGMFCRAIEEFDFLLHQLYSKRSKDIRVLKENKYYSLYAQNKFCLLKSNKEQSSLESRSAAMDEIKNFLERRFFRNNWTLKVLFKLDMFRRHTFFRKGLAYVKEVARRGLIHMFGNYPFASNIDASSSQLWEAHSKITKIFKFTFYRRKFNKCISLMLPSFLPQIKFMQFYPIIYKKRVMVEHSTRYNVVRVYKRLTIRLLKKVKNKKYKRILLPIPYYLKPRMKKAFAVVRKSGWRFR